MNRHRTRFCLLIVQFAQAQGGEWEKGSLCHVTAGRLVYQIKARADGNFGGEGGAVERCPHCGLS